MKHSLNDANNVDLMGSAGLSMADNGAQQQDRLPNGIRVLRKNLLPGLRRPEYRHSQRDRLPNTESRVLREKSVFWLDDPRAQLLTGRMLVTPSSLQD